MIAFVFILLISIVWMINIIGSSHQQTYKKGTFGIVTFIQNEPDILPGWLQYHSAFTPLENILILDNNSFEPTILILQEWEKKGVQVLYHQGPYLAKGVLVYHAVKKHLPNVEIVIPLDADEVLTAFQNRTAIFRKSAMLERLQEFSQSNHSCWALQQYYSSIVYAMNDTINTVQYFAHAEWNIKSAKKIVKNQDLHGLDHGSHTPGLNHNKPCISSKGKLGLLHYHNREPQKTIRTALAAVNGYNFHHDTITLETLPKYREFLVNYTNHVPTLGHAGKFRELIRYLDYGYKVFVHAGPPNPSDFIGSWENITTQMSTEE